MDMTAEERELVVTGLHMRKNYIETGDPVLCARDMANMGRHNEICPLSVDQMRTIVAIDDLLGKIWG